MANVGAQYSQGDVTPSCHRRRGRVDWRKARGRRTYKAKKPFGLFVSKLRAMFCMKTGANA